MPYFRSPLEYACHTFLPSSVLYWLSIRYLIRFKYQVILNESDNSTAFEIGTTRIASHRTSVTPVAPHPTIIHLSILSAEFVAVLVENYTFRHWLFVISVRFTSTSVILMVLSLPIT